MMLVTVKLVVSNSKHTRIEVDRHRSEAEVSNRRLFDVDPGVFAMWDMVMIIGSLGFICIQTFC